MCICVIPAPYRLIDIENTNDDSRLHRHVKYYAYHHQSRCADDGIQQKVQAICTDDPLVIV